MDIAKKRTMRLVFKLAEKRERYAYSFQHTIQGHTLSRDLERLYINVLDCNDSARSALLYKEARKLKKGFQLYCKRIGKTI